MLGVALRRSPPLQLAIAGIRSAHQWEWMRKQGHEINPCNSKLHPAVKAGLLPASDHQLPMQEAYTPNSTCWGCGILPCVITNLLHQRYVNLDSHRHQALPRTALTPPMLCQVNFPGICSCQSQHDILVQPSSVCRASKQARLAAQEFPHCWRP